jgi:tRNA threonylcarbamoyl adenosine modification protein YeaZ
MSAASFMKILALEFSSPHRSVAVVHGSPADQRTGCSEVVETGGGAANVLEMIDAALHQAEAEREEIECLAVGLGPGSYNGIRAAIAMAQGWQLARQVKVVGISSADAVAAEAQVEALFGKSAVVIDAKRDEFYLATYEIDAAGWKPTAALRLATKVEIQAQAQLGERLIGPEVTKWFPGGQIVFPRAALVAGLALLRTDFVSGEKLEPIYLREPRFVKAPPPIIVPI